MRLTVDEYKDEIKQNFENKEWIGNSFAYVGGVPKTKRSTIPEHYSFFRGCMNILKYEANSQLYDLIELSSKGFSKSVIRTEGELSYACTNSTSLPDVISFTNGKGYLALPKWNSLSTGSLAFQFKTSDGNG
uniref:LAM_G_DOMAIN domain-containing protein n=1 Tax=Rhabditophanes sp. KR3021 TaxID=114890 RepID=A0AC35TWG6_9BILA